MTQIMLSVLLLISCSTENPQDAELEYFGFAITNSGFDAPNDSETKTNYLDEVDDFINIVDLNVTSFNDIANEVAAAVQGENKILLHISALFVESETDNSSGSGQKYSLHDDYTQRWNTWMNNQTFDFTNLAAFYLPDEPAWNNFSMTDLHKISKLLKKSFPEVLTLVVEAYPVVSSLSLDDSIDLVGFDQYGILDPLNDIEYQSNLDIIKSEMTSQNLVVIMECQWLEEYENAGFEQSILSSMAQSYYQLAVENNSSMILAYLLPGGFDSPGQKGFRDLNPEVQQSYINIAQKIISSD